MGKPEDKEKKLKKEKKVREVALRPASALTASVHRFASGVESLIAKRLESHGSRYSESMSRPFDRLAGEEAQEGEEAQVGDPSHRPNDMGAE